MDSFLCVLNMASSIFNICVQPVDKIHLCPQLAGLWNLIVVVVLVVLGADVAAAVIVNCCCEGSRGLEC